MELRTSHVALMPLEHMSPHGVSEQLERDVHDRAARIQFGGRPLPPGYSTVWEWMLPRLSYLEKLRHWRGPTQYFAPTALRHPERLAWVFAWNEGNNKQMAARPRPVHDPQALDQEDIVCTWWPILADTTFAHTVASPTGRCVPGCCPPQVENKSQLWWYDVSRLYGARGSPSQLPHLQPQPPVPQRQPQWQPLSQPEPEPKRRSGRWEYAAGSGAQSSSASSYSPRTQPPSSPRWYDRSATNEDDEEQGIVETPGPIIVEISSGDSDDSEITLNPEEEA